MILTRENKNYRRKSFIKKNIELNNLKEKLRDGNKWNHSKKWKREKEKCNQRSLKQERETTMGIS
jgi:hypothetical protein